MGTLSEELAVTIMRNFQLAQLTRVAQWEADLAARMDKPPIWSWTPGTFVFPEGLCCYCGGVMRSDAIWRTDNLQFLGSWKVVGDGNGAGHFEYNARHPHVNNGSICMGSGNFQASSVGDALFMAFNPLSTYFQGRTDADGITVATTEQEIKEWFADRFGHRCGERTDIRTAEGVDLRHVVAPEDGCHCQHCRIHRGEVRCQRDGCGQWYSPNTGHGRFKCTVCGPSGRLRFCVKHKHDSHLCIDCNDIWDNYDVVTCAPFDPPRIRECGKCGEWVCWCCLGEAPHTEVIHSCAREDDAEGTEECSHHCRDCCAANGCEWYADNADF